MALIVHHIILALKGILMGDENPTGASVVYTVISAIIVLAAFVFWVVACSGIHLPPGW